MTSHVVAIGGGGFSMEENPAIDDFVLSLARQRSPRVCFVPTASGDNENYIVRFYKAFTRKPCMPTHLELFRRNVEDLTTFACDQDVLYVGGGNTANMLAVWKLHGFDIALRAAAAQGTVLAGISAGSLCWFESGVTDSFGALTGIDALGLLPGSICPYYDGTASRRDVYHRLIREGMPDGVATEIGVALHYEARSLVKAVTSRSGKKAYRVALTDGVVTETPLEAQFLG